MIRWKLFAYLPPKRMVRLAALPALAALLGAALAGCTVNIQTKILAERSNKAAWGVQQSSDATASTVSALVGVNCASLTACTAVGFSGPSTSDEQTLVQTWSSSGGWQAVSTPNPKKAQTAMLTGLSCASTTSCMAVGSSSGETVSGTNATSPFVTLAERWNGTAWQIVATPNPSGATNSYLTGVACASATSCVAVGYALVNNANSAIAEKWNGKAWTLFPVALPANATATLLYGATCPSLNSCIAVGYAVETITTATGTANEDMPLVETWNGTSWSLAAASSVTGAGLTQLFGIACHGTTACTAVGAMVNSLGQQVPVAERWNGTAWTAQALPAPTGGTGDTLFGVSCAATTACTAVGEYTSGTTGYPMTLAESWNGVSWKIQATKNPQTDPSAATETSDALLGVSCAAATACQAVGTTVFGAVANA